MISTTKVTIERIEQSEKQRKASAEFGGFSCSVFFSLIGENEASLSDAQKFLAAAKRMRSVETLNFSSALEGIAFKGTDDEKLNKIREILVGTSCDATVYRISFADLLKGTEYEGKTIFDVNGNEQFSRTFVDLFSTQQKDDVLNALQRWILKRIENGKFLTEKPKA